MAGLFAQGEGGARGLRDSRRNDSQRQSDLAAKRAPRSKLTENYNCENSQMAIGGDKGRRSPRLSQLATSNKTFGGGARGGVMSDITNVTAGRPNVDKFKPFKSSQQQSFQPPAAVQQSFQPPATAARTFQPPAASTATREMPPPAPTATSFPPAPPAPPAPAAAPAVELTLDDKVLSDPQSVQEYVPDIIEQFFASESRSLPKADYMNSQTDVTGKMRMILIDWLIEVHLKYRLRPETLHLTINLVDRYLSKKQVNKKRLQLIGVVAMFIATKFEEISPPELHDWVYITDNAYTKNDVLLMECNMLATLSFQIVVPTAAHFFEHLATANGCDARHRSCAQYLLELGLLDIRMLQHKPSHMVAAALLLSNELLRRNVVWPEAMVHEARQSEQSLQRCAEELRQLWKADRAGAGGQLQAIHKKFSMVSNHSVATANF